MIIGDARVILHAPLTRYHQIELERVIEIANSRLAVLPGLLRFEMASMKGDAQHREYQTQIRAISAAASDGVEFRYGLPLRHSGCASFDDFAWDLVGRAHDFLTDGRLAREGAAARDAVGPIIADAAGLSIIPRLIAVGVSFEFSERTPWLCADIEMLGNDLELGTERVFGVDAAHLRGEVARFVENHAKRDAARIRAHYVCASGWIDQTALRLIDAARIGRSATIALVAKEGRVNISVPGRDGDVLDATLDQIHGVVTGSVMPRSRRWSLNRGDLIIWGEGLPETLRIALAGRRVGEIFWDAELPLDAVVTIVDEVTSVDPESDDEDEIDGWIRLMLDVPVAEVDRVTGDARDTWTASDHQGDERRAQARLRRCHAAGSP